MRTLVAAAIAMAAAVTDARAQDARPPLELLDVPYISQSEALCGGAAAAMVMRFWGATGVYAETFEPLVDRAAGGITGDALLRDLQARGWDARSFRGDQELVRGHLAKRRPVVALIEDRPGRFHYVVVVAWPPGRVVLHDPARAPFRILTEEAFTRAWDAAGRWTMLALPGSPPASGTTAAAENRRSPESAAPASPCAAMVDEGIRLAGTGDVEGARRVLELATATCPSAAGPWRELAGLHALRSAWGDAAADARRAIDRDPRDHHAWRILATSLYVEGDQIGALQAWNQVGEPRVDLVNIIGLERTRFNVAAGALAIVPQTTLTAAALARARRRLAELPAAHLATVTYQPAENGLARVEAVVLERPMVPTSPAALLATGARLISDRELLVAIAAPTGGGELWTASYRWWERRERVAFGFESPAPFGGTWSIDAFDERQAYGAASDSLSERRRGASFGIADWMTGNTGWRLKGGADKWRGLGTAVALGGGLEQHVSDKAALSVDGGTWIGNVRTWTLDGRATWRSSLDNEGTVVLASTGVMLAGESAPLDLWGAAGTGPASDVLLRAHRVLDEDAVNDAVFGRRVLHGHLEWRRWWQAKTRPLKFAPALFVDAARASRGAAFTDARAHVDVGAGLRVPVPGAGMLRVDVGYGLRDGRTAISVGVIPTRRTLSTRPSR